MTSGRLAAVNVDAGTNTLIYTIAGSKPFSVTVNMCNRNSSDVTVRLALVDGVLANLSDEDYIEYDVVIRAGGLVERSGIDMTPGQSLIGYSNKGNVSFQVWA